MGGHPEEKTVSYKRESMIHILNRLNFIYKAEGLRTIPTFKQLLPLRPLNNDRQRIDIISIAYQFAIDLQSSTN